MDSNHPRRLYESHVLPTELASLFCTSNLAGRAGFEPAHGVSNSHVPFQLGYRPKTTSAKKQKAPTFVGASEIESELGNLTNNQTNPEGRARLTRRLIMDLVFIVIFETEYSTAFGWNPALTSCSVTQVTRCPPLLYLSPT
jgi:hypothetical protein